MANEQQNRSHVTAKMDTQILITSAFVHSLAADSSSLKLSEKFAVPMY